ncbi:hypothetical protein HDU91_004610, partial [Kappamyces sp. JEL0680]
MLGFWVQTILTNFNTSKSKSSLFKALLLDLNRRQEVVDALGTDIEYDINNHKRVKGQLNHIKGHASLEFNVEGSKDRIATVSFVGSRWRDTDCWVSSEYRVTVDDTVLDL